jgi:hypothetical protein
LSVLAERPYEPPPPPPPPAEAVRPGGMPGGDRRPGGGMASVSSTSSRPLPTAGEGICASAPPDGVVPSCSSSPKLLAVSSDVVETSGVSPLGLSLVSRCPGGESTSRGRFAGDSVPVGFAAAAAWRLADDSGSEFIIIAAVGVGAVEVGVGIVSRTRGVCIAVGKRDSSERIHWREAAAQRERCGAPRSRCAPAPPAFRRPPWHLSRLCCQARAPCHTHLEVRRAVHTTHRVPTVYGLMPWRHQCC